MNLTKKELNKIPKLLLKEGMHNNNGLIYQINESLLLKLFRSLYDYLEEVERNVDYQIKSPIPHTPRVYDKIYVDQNFVGYSMEYIANACTFREAIGKNIDMDVRKKAIIDCYETLKYLHQFNIFLGDIHLDNFLITPMDGYVIDLDYMRFVGDEYKFQQCYLIQPSYSAYKVNIASFYSDNAKLMISSLALLLDVDLEKYISKKEHSINLEQLYNEFLADLNNEALDRYFKSLIEGEFTEYFSDSDAFFSLVCEVSR